MPGKGLNVFISYSHEDRGFAGRLKRILSKASKGQTIHGVLDSVDVNQGARWDDHLLDAIRDSHVMLLVLSEQSLRSATVPSEFGVALAQDKPVISVVPPNRRLPHELMLPLRKSDLVRAGKLTDDEISITLSKRLTELATREVAE